MSEEIEQGTPNSGDTNLKSSVAVPAPIAASAAAATDKWSTRRAELKRQKRRAHRRHINASNTSG